MGAKNKPRVAVGISGGVDSSVAAALLKEQGFDIVGVFMECWTEGEGCTADQDRADALKVAKELDIPFRVFDFKKQYRKEVIDYFFNEYKAGRTPNPDVYCNSSIKFGAFLEKAREELGADYVATGHYARVVDSSQLTESAKGKPRNSPTPGVLPSTPGVLPSGVEELTGLHLLRGMDEQKDQSYFLWKLTQDQLEYILFPIGGYTKDKVRELARGFGLHTYNRPDSQGICFVGRVDLKDFLKKRIKPKKGPVVNTKGEVIGEHEGVWFYTEGQRRGFTVFKPSLPLYVVAKDVEKNTLVVGRGEESRFDEFEVVDPNWVNEQTADSLPAGKAGKQLTAGVRIRHLGEITSAKIKSLDNKPLTVSRKLKAELAKPAFGIALGQHAVFYKDEEVLGGGIINKVRLPEKVEAVVSGGRKAEVGGNFPACGR